MAKKPWTQEQRQAITARGCDLLLSAAAGSGKTAVLVERIIKRITEGEAPLDIDRLLVVTFTQAAAAEMRERIGRALRERLTEEPENSHLQRQLLLLQRAYITTIHSFCLEVIRENYDKIGIDPAFRIADESEIQVLKAELLEELFEGFYEDNDEGFLSLVESYGESTGDKRLKQLVLDLYEFIQSNPYPKRWLTEVTERYHIEEDVPLDRTYWGGFLRQEIEYELVGLLDVCELAVTIAERETLEYLDAVIADRELLETLHDSLYQGLSVFYSCLKGVAFQKLGRRKKDTPLEYAEKIKTLREQIKESVKKLKDRMFFKEPEEMKQDIMRLYPVLTALSHVTEQFSVFFQEKKRERQIVDFNDLEHYCLEILLEEGSTEENPRPSEAAGYYQEQFAEILTDEYQDSNFVQELILEAVSRKTWGENNRFMVGDVKQSIYRFRLAKPELFLEKYARYPEAKGGKERKIDLFRNFRSREQIIYGINFLFRQLMTKELGELTYDEKAALYPGAVFEPPKETISVGGPIEVVLLETGKSAQEEQTEEMELLTVAEQELRYIAHRIKQLMQEPFYVWDTENEAYRPVKYQDIVVLLRSPAAFGSVAEGVFSSFGIPSYMDSSNGYFESLEILTLISLLEIIDNPRQDIPLLAVLHSPIFSFQNSELMQIRLEAEKESFYSCMLSYAGRQDVLAEKVRQVLEKLSVWRERAVASPVNEFLWYLYTDSGYYDYVGITPTGGLRQANLRALIEKAVQYEKTSLRGLFYFIRYLDKIKQSSADMGAARVTGETENLVRIMSIHKSKGLEFPVVFLAGLGRRFNRTDVTGNVLLHPELGFGSTYIDFKNRVSYYTIPRTIVAMKLLRENLSEEMRILYVALTRAKEKLILTGCTANLQKAFLNWTMYQRDGEEILPSYQMARANCFLDWILPAVSRHRHAAAAVEQAGAPRMAGVYSLWDDVSEWNLTLLNGNTVWEAEEEAPEPQEARFPIPPMEEDEALSVKQNVWKRLAWEYPYQENVGMPASLSISELKRRYTQREQEDNSSVLLQESGTAVQELEKPQFLKREESLSAAAKGTALHTVLEHIDFHRQYTKESLQALLQELTEKTILTPQEVGAISVHQIELFLNSTLSRRMYQSRRVEKERPFVLGMTPAEIYGQEEGGKTEETLLVQGVIDCYFYEGDAVILLDYKSDYVTEKTIEQVVEKYRLQLSLYKKALERLTGRQVTESYLYLFGLNRAVKVEETQKNILSN